MAEGESELDRVALEVSPHELMLINNALNEVCHGVEIGEAEFPTRLGGSRDEAKALLRRVGQLLRDNA